MDVRRKGTEGKADTRGLEHAYPSGRIDEGSKPARLPGWRGLLTDGHEMKQRWEVRIKDPWLPYGWAKDIYRRGGESARSCCNGGNGERMSFK